MTQVIVTKPGALSPADKRMLRKFGVVPIEAAEPSEVRLLSLESSPIAGNDLAFAAVRAVQHDFKSQAALAKYLLEAMTEAREGIRHD